MTIPTLPRGLRTGPRAQSDNPVSLIRDLNGAFNDFRVRNDARIDGLEAAIEQGMVRNATTRLGGAGSDGLPQDREYTNAFASYFRKGDGEQPLREANAQGERLAIQNAMSVGTNSDGGYLAPVEWDRQVRQKLRDSSPMRQIAQVQATQQRGLSARSGTNG